MSATMPVDGRLRGDHRRLGVDDLRLRRADPGLGRGLIRLRFRDRGIGCLFSGAGVVERLLGLEVLGRHRLDAREPGCRRRPQGFAGGDLGNCSGLLGFALPHHGFRGLNSDLGAFQLGLGFPSLRLERFGVHMDEHSPRGDEVPLVHQNLGDPPRNLGVDVDLGPLDTAVAAREALGQAGGPELQPSVIAAARERENDDDPDERLAEPMGRSAGLLRGLACPSGLVCGRFRGARRCAASRLAMNGLRNVGHVGPACRPYAPTERLNIASNSRALH